MGLGGRRWAPSCSCMSIRLHSDQPAAGRRQPGRDSNPTHTITASTGIQSSARLGYAGASELAPVSPVPPVDHTPDGDVWMARPRIQLYARRSPDSGGVSTLNDQGLFLTPAKPQWRLAHDIHKRTQCRHARLRICHSPAVQGQDPPQPRGNFSCKSHLLR